jgi:hypothetical protein
MAELTEKEVLLRRIVKRKTDGGGVDRAAHTASDSTTTPSTPNGTCETRTQLFSISISRLLV